jgi:hypothetical protein
MLTLTVSKKHTDFIMGDQQDNLHSLPGGRHKTLQQILSYCNYLDLRPGRGIVRASTRGHRGRERLYNAQKFVR